MIKLFSKNTSYKLLRALLGAAIYCCVINDSMAASLKENSVIKGDKITLGDVFYDLPKDETRILGVAPRPGQEITLNSRVLLRIALASGLDWRPSSVTDRVVLKRDATIIDKEEIESKITKALKDKGVSGNFTIEIPMQFQKIALPSDSPAEFEIAKIDIASDYKKFDAVIVAPSSEHPIQTMQVTGKILPVIEVPVLRVNVQNGTIITFDDIETAKIRDTDLTADVITDPNALIGMTARRVIIAGRSIKNVDIISKKIVERGKLVVLSLNAGSLSLTTEAKALENGAKGDVIRVLNTSSNQTLQAVVIAENQVSVTQN